VTAYQLVNFEEFSPEGRYIGKTKTAQVAPVETVKQAEAETV
jgi:hypothetical protein